MNDLQTTRSVVRSRVVLRRARRGGVLFELTIACGVMLLLFAGVAQTSVVFLRQQRVALERELAATEAANLLDLAATIPFDKLTIERLNETASLSDVGKHRLNANVSWTVTPKNEEDLQCVVVQVEMRWGGESDPKSLKLTQWRFAGKEGAP